MENINAETTLGNLAASFTDLLIEKASEKMITGCALENNIIKGEVYNVTNASDKEMILIARINEFQFKATKSYSSCVQDKNDTVYDISKYTKEPVYLSSSLIAEVVSQIKTAIITSLSLNYK